ncbi:TPA: DUF1146 domain-containing protein [Streptococcus equi subsp. zooepidemicus]|nr:DUF1146 domain-containing protein [Streptococcus equi subsp. zooepidemicus]HEL0711853.1 DUF1146 domain-containing protein [Streptococcus equi subsp. zooepidemicus]HEL0737477.1 DUF1146 domain-containing protein [Streptococcus equi subsp. zooepidemicus]HEL0767304.1 DUF1146 domain-containing protein [Streptococcus equi subsp. zooepidemicus]HEL1301382.1 DUF1146 domain-containing protein [Streptococcus equi subsp. zooepidemicus]
MEVIRTLLMFFSHLLFIGISYQVLISLVDWSKFIHYRPENMGRLRLLVLFLAIALGYLVSRFMLELIQISQYLLYDFH